ncbi:M99 family metallo-carboxypeptidase C-terminal domain-containing protein [Campylobacter sputorum]|uniref:M99 family metallo-carboxypeptidase C-terminal domain-containing protein n=3 Tax=Campylobacter sputorum TaxID=206 RepID=UPI002B4BA302|nr:MULTISPECIES: M99 family metallo-carboxypeptidase C-terminal domain-containing protein [unclassified Campylobacter]
MILVEFQDVKPSKEKAFEITIVKDEKNNIFRLDDKFFAFIDDIKSKLNFVPMQKNDVNFSSNLNSLNLKKENYSYKIYSKNKVLTTLNPEYFEYSDILNGIYINVDENINSFVNFGTKIKAKSIKIEHINGVRVNVIGYNSGKNDESGIFIRKKDLDKKFSIDKAGNIYRVEFYELNGIKDKFIGMILVEFE